MLKLLTFHPGLGVRSPSPFAVKADALLAMSGLEYELEYGTPQKAPRGKYPVLVDGGQTIPDTAHIQTHLETKNGVDFDGHLSREQKATVTAFRRLIEHHLYFLNAYFRWHDHPDAIKYAYFESAPALIRGFVFSSVKKTLMKGLHLQGLSRHSRAEMEEFVKQDVDAIAAQLGDKPYFMGDAISSIDASLFGALHNMIDCDLESPGKRFCAAHDNLQRYNTAMKTELFGE